MQERGSVVPLVSIAMVVVVASIWVLIELVGRAVMAADAQTAADMAALAGVFEGRDGAEDLAAENGADLVDYWSTGVVIHVVVELGTARAEAAAVYDDQLENPFGIEVGG